MICRGLSLGYPFLLHYFLKGSNSNWKGRKACFTLSFDCDYEEDVVAMPHLLDMLDRYKISASFACVGKWIEKFPEIHRNLIDRGHEIVNHTYSHPDNELLDPNRRFNELKPAEKRKQIVKCHKVCMKLLNYEVVGFRTPHFGRLFSKEDYPILRELGYTYSSSTKIIGTTENGQPFVTREGIVEFPLSTCPRHPFAVFDSWHTTSQRNPGSIHRSSNEFLKLFKQLVNLTVRTHSYTSVYFDPQDIIKVESFEQALKFLADSTNNLRIATYSQVANMLAMVS